MTYEEQGQRQDDATSARLDEQVAEQVRRVLANPRRTRR